MGEGAEKFKALTPETDRFKTFLRARVLGGGTPCNVPPLGRSNAPSLARCALAVWCMSQPLAEASRYAGAAGVFWAICPHFQKICPQMCPHMPPDGGTLHRTTPDDQKPVSRGKKKKSAPSRTCADFDVVPITGIELVTYALRMRCSTN